MKICPFISHMIGEEQTGILEIHDTNARNYDGVTQSGDSYDDGAVGVAPAVGSA